VTDFQRFWQFFCFSSIYFAILAVRLAVLSIQPAVFGFGPEMLVNALAYTTRFCRYSFMPKALTFFILCGINYCVTGLCYNYIVRNRLVFNNESEKCCSRMGVKISRRKVMKRTTCIIAVLLTAALLVTACATGGGGGGSSGGGAATSTDGRKVSSRVPDFVRKAIINAPEDALVGVGSAKMATDNMSRTMATTRARAEISRQMSTMIQDMIRDYTAASEVDPSAALSFQENITVALSKAELTGSKVVDIIDTADGTFWVIVQLGKTNVVQEINQAQAAAKLAIPAMASFNAEDRMNAAFDKAYNTEVSYSGD
jgi:predicted small secreted protein